MITLKNIQEAIDHMAKSGLVNSGALVELDPETLEIEVVEVSASSHVSPIRGYSAEAPRLYGPASDRAVKDTWLSWTANILTGGKYGPPPIGVGTEKWRKQTLRLIERKLVETEE